MPIIEKMYIPSRKKFSFSSPLTGFVWSEMDLVRIAALLEFSWIGISQYNRNRNIKRSTHNLRMDIKHKSKDLMEWLITNFGGSYGNNKGSCFYRWEVRGMNAAILMHECQKYLISKKEHAAIVILYSSTIVKPGTRKHHPLSDDEIRFRDELQEKLRLINLGQRYGVENIKDEMLKNNPFIGSLFDFDNFSESISYKEKGFFDDFLSHITKKG